LNFHKETNLNPQIGVGVALLVVFTNSPTFVGVTLLEVFTNSPTVVGELLIASSLTDLRRFYWKC
jgi:hypothetical protein